jgi:hypothetical protein
VRLWWLVTLSACALIASVLLPVTGAHAADEFADAEITIVPRSGPTFFTDAFSSAEGVVSTSIRLPGPPSEFPVITPLKVSDLRFPPSSVLTFNPKPSMPVCPDDQLGPPPTTNSIPVPEMIARCPGSLIGNGTAKFALARLTQPNSSRDGEVLIFNGGRVGDLPKIKIYAYSYDLTVGIYTSSILEPDGRLRIEIPSLPVDSAVTSIDLSIPGRKVVRPKPDLGVTVTLPAGRDPDYLQVRCPRTGGLPWTTELTLGTRPGGAPSGDPDIVVGDSGTAPCTGVPARPRLAPLRVSGPRAIDQGRRASFRVQIRNSGPKPATGGRLIVSGRGVRTGLPVGTVGAGMTRTVKVAARFLTRGKVRVTFRLKTANAGSTTAVRSVSVR